MDRKFLEVAQIKTRESKSENSQMRQLKIKNYNGLNVTDSREVADMIGKRHSDLLRSIDNYVEILTNAKLRSLEFFIKSSYEDSKKEIRPCYLLTKQGCEMVANKMTGEKGILFTAEYVQAFNQMEEHIKQPKMLSATEQLELQLQAMKEQDKKIEAVNERVAAIEERMTIETGKQKVLSDLVNKKVVAVLGGKDAPAYKELGTKAFRQCWRDYKNKLDIASYKDTPLKDFEMGKKIIIDWQPTRELELMIRGCNAQIRM